jgi:hypothetical protein
VSQQDDRAALVGAMNSLQQQISQLQAQVAQLKGAASIEAGQPNYLTINPATGAIGANFTGLINALGLILPAALPPLTQTPSNTIEWQRPSDGTPVADIYAFRANADTNSFLEITADTIAGDANPSAIIVSSGPQSKRLIGSDGTSSFMQIGPVQGTSTPPSKWVAEFGFVPFTWVGGVSNQFAATVTFTNLATQGYVFCTFYNNSGLTSGGVYAQGVGVNNVSFGVQAFNGAPGAGRVDGFYWLVIHD